MPPVVLNALFSDESLAQHIHGFVETMFAATPVIGTTGSWMVLDYKFLLGSKRSLFTPWTGGAALGCCGLFLEFLPRC